MDIAYKAQTDTCTFLLDGKGICRSVLAATSNSRAAGARDNSRAVRIPSTAERCIGAQYVACIDMREIGAMVATPRAGAQMLFARTERDGRITLVRTGAIVRFETVAPDALDSGVRERPEPSRYDEVDDQEELTTPFACATVPFRREMLAPIMRSARAPAPSPAQPPPTTLPAYRASSIPPAIPNRTSGVVPTSQAARATIPPPPPMMRRAPSYAPPAPSPVAPSEPIRPRRPSIARVSTPSPWGEAPPPRKRAAR